MAERQDGFKGGEAEASVGTNINDRKATWTSDLIFIG